MNHIRPILRSSLMCPATSQRKSGVRIIVQRRSDLFNILYMQCVWQDQADVGHDKSEEEQLQDMCVLL